MHTVQLRIAIVSAMAGTAVLLAGCGGAAKPPSGGSAAGAPPKDGIAAAYKFSRCMRDHGVSSFPDPVVHSTSTSQSVGIRITPGISGSPSFNSAQKACQGILPGAGNSNDGQTAAQQAAHRKGLLGFATCMRSHQVPSFPDPNTQGDITPQMLTAAGLNLHAPAVGAAARACISSSDGVVNAAAVQRAINGGG